MSDSSETGASGEPANGSAILGCESENSAQQIAQHEDATGAGGVPFSEVMAQTGIDPALRLLIEAWGELPDSTRNRILRIADEALKMTIDSANAFQGKR